jgi:hypothetical protein
LPSSSLFHSKVGILSDMVALDDLELLAFYDVIPIKLNLKVKMMLDAENPLNLERHKAKGLKG